MRNIIFRGKRINRNGEWGYGDLRRYKENWWIFPNHRAAAYDADMVDPETVGQYVGIIDKNGNRVFEGDVVDIARLGRYEVKYDKYGCAALLKEGEHHTLPFTSYGFFIDRKNMVVVGNIYDNPELLKQE